MIVSSNFNSISGSTYATFEVKANTIAPLVRGDKCVTSFCLPSSYLCLALHAQYGIGYMLRRYNASSWYLFEMASQIEQNCGSAALVFRRIRRKNPDGTYTILASQSFGYDYTQTYKSTLDEVLIMAHN